MTFKFLIIQYLKTYINLKIMNSYKKHSLNINYWKNMFEGIITVYTHIFSDGVRVVDAVDPLWHEQRFLLVSHCVAMFPCDVAQPGDHPQTLCDLPVHRPVHVVEQIERLGYQLVTLGDGARLDLALARRVEVVRVWRLSEERDIYPERIGPSVETVGTSVRPPGRHRY